MNQVTRKALRLFVALVMLLSLMPSVAFATEPDDGSTQPNFETVEDFINSSYEPGEATYKGMSVVETGLVLKYSSAESEGEETGLYYVIAETSEGRTVLGVGGNGEIPQCDYRGNTYNSYKKMPWAKYDAENPDKPIKDIYLENGVTRAYAFSFHYSKAETLSIAGSVNQIDDAFKRCYYLRKIYVPITTRINSSFALCADSATASSTREIIYVDTGKDASVVKHNFGDKSGITKVTFPASVTTITDNYFSDAAEQYSSLTELKFEDGNNVISMTVSAGKLDNIADIAGLSDVSKATLLGSESLKNSSWYTNNAGTITTENGFKVINGIQLVEYTGSDENVTIPEGIEVIGSCAFFGKEIKSITIPKSVNYISERAFLCCRNLENVTFEGADDGTSKLRIIGKLAFAGTAIKEITLPASLETIEEAAFVNVGGDFAKTEEYVITNGAVGEAIAVLEKVRIVDTEENPSKLKTIGKFAFNSCRNLTEINIPDSVQSFAMGSFRRCMTLKEINLPEGMKAIPGYCFVFCEKLTSVTIPESVESIGDWAFEGCSGLTEIRIPANVQTLGSGAFEQQHSIKAFYIDSPSFKFFNGTESGKARTFLGASDCKMYVVNQEMKDALLSKNIFIKNDDDIIVYPAVIGAKGYPTLAEAVQVAGDSDTIVTQEHKYIKHLIEESTCTKQGVKAHWECQDLECDFFIPCEGTIEELSSSEDRERLLTIPMVGHTFSYVDEVPATYEADGVKAHQHCSVCGKNFINDVEKTDEELRIPKLTSPSGGDTSNVITVENTKHGNVSITPKSASSGTTVTITVEPDAGYKLATLTITDGSGNVLKLIHQGNGKYTFTMPSSGVSVKASFVLVNPFVDVSSGAYYYDAVLWAAENGIAKGTSATAFSPNAPCTRAQAVTFLWRAAGCPAPKSSVLPFATKTGNGSTQPNFETVEDFINSSYEPGEATYKGMSVVETGLVLKYSSAESEGEETGLYYVIAETSEGRTVLGVGGNGEIPQCDYRGNTYNSYKKMPWAKYDAANPDKPIKDIYLENGVTRAYAFSFLSSKAETLSIADSVNQIDDAFKRCYYLREIYVPITTCINSSFALCADSANASSTREIVYVDTGKDASVVKHNFGDKSGITKVTFPASVTTITDNYFSDAAEQYSSLTELKFEDGNNVIGMTVSAGKLDNIADIAGLSDVSKATLLGSESLKKSPWYTANQNEIKITTTADGFKVLNGIQLVEYTGSDENVTIPEGIEVIGSCAFFGKEIKSITIPKSVKFIGERAFLCCRNLENVTFEGADDGTSTLRIIGKLAFAGTAIKEITLPASLESIEEAAFVNVGEDFAKTEEYFITSGAVGEAVAVLEKVRIVDTEENPSKLKTIGKFAFNSCRNLTEINIPDSVQSFAMGSFRRCMTLKEINLPEGMKAIPGHCFVFCEKLTSVTIPESVESIGDWAFAGCSGLTEFRIPANVQTLGSGAFQQQHSIKAFYIASPSFEFFNGTESGKYRTFLGDSDCKMYVVNQEIKDALLSKNIFIKNEDDIIVSPAVVNPFVDVSSGAYYYDAVLWAVANGITEGTSATTFSPNAPCTRAQAVTFLWRAAGCPAPKSSVMPFTDVKAGSYYETAVLWAVENGIADGTSATTFSPDANCTRGQIVTFLYRYFED